MLATETPLTLSTQACHVTSGMAVPTWDLDGAPKNVRHHRSFEVFLGLFLSLVYRHPCDIIFIPVRAGAH